MKRLFLCFSLCVALHSLWARQTESIFREANVIAPSPEATAMNKFIDLPVGHYTGIPNVSVPIYTLQLPQMSLPISLNYHAGGLKVGEHSTWVGAGWSLNAGGSINRTVRGLPDEYVGPVPVGECVGTGYGFLRLDTKYFTPDMTGVSVSYLESMTYQVGRPNGTVKQGCLTEEIDFFDNGVYDTEPDLYHFSFPGGSGKFLYKRNKQLVKVSADDVNFGTMPVDAIPGTNTTPVNLSGTSFTLTDAAGVLYTFEAVEMTNTYSLCVGNDPSGDRNGVNPLLEHPSSWKLTRMSLANNWIDFEYEVDQITYDDQYSSKSYVISGPGAGGPLTTCVSERRVATQRLKTITTSNGYKVTFNKSDSRLDLTGGKRLTDITIEKDGLIILNYALDNDDYFGINKKLKLNAVNRLSTDLNSDNQLPGYEFDYHIGAGDFPDRFSHSQDYWGYYNGADNGSNMIPYSHEGGNLHVNKNTHVDRSPSFPHTLKGTLSRLTYPTGGYTNFVYELNTFYHDSFQKNYRTTLPAPAQGVIYQSPSFEVSQTGSVEVLTYGNEVSEHTWELERFSGGSWSAITVPLGDFTLNAGTYRFTVTNITGPGNPVIEDPTTSTSSERVTFRIISKFNEVVNNEVSGGLRIKNLEFYDPVKSATITKRYVYTDDLGASTGRQFTGAWVNGIRSEFIEGEVFDQNCTNQETIISVVQSHSSSTPLSTYQGSHIGYGTVYEVAYEPCTVGNGGCTWSFDSEDGFSDVSSVSSYTFENTWDAHDNPNIPQPDYSFKNGKLKEQYVYKYSGTASNWRDNLTTLQHTSYDYEEIDDGIFVRGLFVKEVNDSRCYQWYVGDPLDLSVARVAYTIPSTWYRLKKQTTTQYDENGLNPMVSEQLFEYDPAVTHYMPTGSERTDSDGSIITASMVRLNHAPALVAQQEVFRKWLNGPDGTASTPVEIQLSGESVAYHGILPSSYSTWNRDIIEIPGEISTSYETVAQYQYDGESNLIQAQKRPSADNETMSAYLWSYDGAYVVAQVTNITSTELENLLTMSREDFSNLTNTDAIRTELNSLRNSLNSQDQKMTVYLFEERFGISEMQDANGQTIKYLYDEFGRLIKTVDQNGNLVNAYRYNYMNPSQAFPQN